MIIMNRLPIYLLVALLAVGCATRVKSPVVEGEVIKLDESKGVLVSMPPDGSFEGRSYPESGRFTAYAIEAALARHAVRTDVVTHCHGVGCLDSVDTEEFGYYVMPVILHWEDQTEGWSGKPDRIIIQMRIFDTSNGLELGRFAYEGNSQWATIRSDRPEDLLPEATNPTIDLLYK